MTPWFTTTNWWWCRNTWWCCCAQGGVAVAAAGQLLTFIVKILIFFRFNFFFSGSSLWHCSLGSQRAVALWWSLWSSFCDPSTKTAAPSLVGGGAVGDRGGDCDVPGWGVLAQVHWVVFLAQLLWSHHQDHFSQAVMALQEASPSRWLWCV